MTPADLYHLCLARRANHMQRSVMYRGMGAGWEAAAMDTEREAAIWDALAAQLRDSQRKAGR